MMKFLIKTSSIDVVSLKLLEKLAESENAFVQYHLDKIYAEGKITEKNKDKALYWLHGAEQQGHIDAYNLIGELLHRERVKGPLQLMKAICWYKRGVTREDPLASQNHPVAKFNLGLAYLRGDGIEQNDDERYVWNMRAANQGLDSVDDFLVNGYCSVEQNDYLAEILSLNIYD